MPRGSFFIFGKNFYKFRKRRGALIYGASRLFLFPRIVGRRGEKNALLR
nr:MAG TPA: hypothetical protein [Caudoviricetes sp.]